MTNERAEWWSSSSSSDESQDNANKTVTIREIEKIVQDGKKRGLHSQKIFDLWDRLEVYTLKVQEAFMHIDQCKQGEGDGIGLEKLQQLYDEF